MKHVYAKIDYLGENWGLNCLRTKDGREVDFALTKDNKIESILEVKISDGEPSKTLVWFQEKYGFFAVQIIKELRHEHRAWNISIRRADKFLQDLDL